MKNLNQITEEMMEHVCDKICRYPRTVNDQDELNYICAECKMELFVRDIINSEASTKTLKGRRIKAECSIDNLCDTCTKCFADCNAKKTKFGPGIDKIKVIECDAHEEEW